MSEAPILFLKTGVMGAEPLHFYDSVARTYNADHYDMENIRMELSGGRQRFDKHMTNLTKDTMLRRTTNSLEDGKNVLYGGFLNSIQRRQRITDVAKPIGTNIVMLCVHAPWDLIEERLRERHASGDLGYPKEFDTDVSRVIYVARSMKRTVEWPEQAAGEVSLHLYGTESIPELLGGIAQHLSERALVPTG